MRLPCIFIRLSIAFETRLPWTQNELSQRAEMSFQNVQKIERGGEKGGAKSITIETLEQVLKALDLPSEKLTDAKQKAITLIYQSLEEILEQQALPTE